MTLPAKCRTCRYSTWVNVGHEREMLYACQYIILRGTKRPCPAGAGCTVYEPRRKEK